MKAEPLVRTAYDSGRRILGPEQGDVLASELQLAMLYRKQGHYKEAEPLYRRSLKIVEQALGPNNLEMVKPLNNLATLYLAQGKHAEAEPLFKQSLAIPSVPISVGHFASLQLE